MAFMSEKNLALTLASPQDLPLDGSEGFAFAPQNSGPRAQAAVRERSVIRAPAWPDVGETRPEAEPR